ncbi:MAG TPA: M28 family peptidase [Bryobacteraceae bacterium]|jgi:hypothetical protein|nr:M28 family peptidase [Bryobacteraceae bacterium]
MKLALAASLALWLGLSLVPRSRPAPLPDNAPATEFSAIRAIGHVRAIAQQPHPIGSAEHDRVRDYIVSQLTSQGLAPHIEAGHAEFTRGRYHGAGDVQNIVARLAGTAGTRPLMLAAHYDSVARGPGAGDDGHGVGVLLETLRALRAGPALRNDVIFLITDGEERGLLGAQVFMREDPWRFEPGVTLNFEARGTSGSATMFETSTGNEWLIRGLQAAVPQADATSVAYEIYKRMPNDTDLTVFKGGGLAGMNFAFIGHPEYYHTAQDTVEHLDPMSVQEQGRYALSLVRWFGNRDLRTHPSGDAVYFATAFTPLIVYPVRFATVLGIVALLGALASAWRRPAAGVPLLLLAVLGMWVATVAPGISYLIAWPVLGAVLATLPRTPNIAAMALGAAPGFLLIVPLVSSLVVALSWRGAAPILAAAAVLMLICLLPQLLFLMRTSAPAGVASAD